MDQKDNIEFRETEDRLEEIDKPIEIVYDTTKDFYKGIRGELRFKAEGLFKKAREKGISIENIEIATLKEESVEFPGLGNVELPTYVVKVRGMVLENQQTMVDGKQIDFYNRYQKYAAEKIEDKNLVKDEHEKAVYNNKRLVIKQNPDLNLSDWEKFEIGKAIIEDKEFGLEKTITGACDRVIRKLMGENDWLYPGEARLLEEEFNEIDKKAAAREAQGVDGVSARKASEKQLSYFKSRVRNMGLDPEDKSTIRAITDEVGIDYKPLEQFSISEMSRLIDSISRIAPIVKKKLSAKVVQ